MTFGSPTKITLPPSVNPILLLTRILDLYLLSARGTLGYSRSHFKKSILQCTPPRLHKCTRNPFCCELYVLSFQKKLTPYLSLPSPPRPEHGGRRGLPKDGGRLLPVGAAVPEQRGPDARDQRAHHRHAGLHRRGRHLALRAQAERQRAVQQDRGIAHLPDRGDGDGQ